MNGIEADKFNPKDLIAPPDFINHWSETITDEQYHADKTALGSSQIRQANRSLKEFHRNYMGAPDKETKEMILGRRIHMAILEPERFKKHYVVEPVFEGRTAKGEWTTSANCKEVKEKRSQWLADIDPGAVIVTQKELDIITGIAQAINEYDDAIELVKGAKPEVTGYYRDPQTGLKIKIRPDLMLLGNIALVTDLKSTVDARDIKFGNAVFGDDKRYDIQLFTYAEGIFQITGKEVPQVHIIAVEKEPPYECAVYFFLREDLAQAEQDYRSALMRIRTAIDHDQWPQRQRVMSRIYTPKWFIDETTIREDIESA